MALWFECKARCDRAQEDGSFRKVTETFMVDALSFTEAEARLIEERKPFMKGEFSIPAIKKTRVSDVHFTEGKERWWNVKYYFIVINEKTGAERRLPYYALVQADTSEEATARFNETMRSAITDYGIERVAETPVLEVYPFTVNAG